MTTDAQPDIASNRLSAEEYAENFSDLHEPLSSHEALVESDRCYFCYDAPCVSACPTSIDIPLFIRQIATGNPESAAKTILNQNIMGGMCARVCPTETLCEEICVRETAEGKPVKIGQLQRYATDELMALSGPHPFERAPATGKKVAVVGAGPAGLSCAHKLATYGHDVTVFEARAKPGGLNEFGIAAYKANDNFAAREVDFILEVGGIEIKYEHALGQAVTISELTDQFDAVFLGMGLPEAHNLGLPGEDAEGAQDAVTYIEDIRQADELAQLPVGRNIVIIGGGMTAIDIATQTKLLGAESVTICYRRGQEQMNASDYEQEVAQTAGVTIRHWLQPKSILTNDGAVTGIELEYTRQNGELKTTGEVLTLEADQIFKAIGQSFDASPLEGSGIELERGRVAVDANHRTSVDGIWAGGDCITGDEDLTVVAVEHGKIAAEDINRSLS